MYPILRLALERHRARRLPPLGPGEMHVTRTRCWPLDLDPWMELNNGRTLSLFDLGRVALGERSGLPAALARHGWRLSVAGSSVRYRRRVVAFDRLEIRSAILGCDRRFFYVHQAMLREGEPTSSVLIRSTISGPGGIVPTDAVRAALGWSGWNPALPPWVAAWAEADALRPWPPDLPAEAS